MFEEIYKEDYLGKKKKPKERWSKALKIVEEFAPNSSMKSLLQDLSNKNKSKDRSRSEGRHDKSL